MEQVIFAGIIGGGVAYAIVQLAKLIISIIRTLKAKEDDLPGPETKIQVFNDGGEKLKTMGERIKAEKRARNWAWLRRLVDFLAWWR